MQTPTRFKAVPFNPAWVAHDKIDIRAIYRRPVRDHRGRQKLVDGVPQWDYTGGLPVRRHYDWTKKGFEYVTLSSGEDFTDEVVKDMRAHGLEPRDYIMDEIARSPWNPELYLATAGIAEKDRFDALTAMVEKFGSDAVIEIKRADNPQFTLPEHLQGIPPGGTAKPLRTDVRGKLRPGEIADRAGYEQAKAEGRITEIPPRRQAPRPKAVRNNAAGRLAKKAARAGAAPVTGGGE